jgi:bacterioferritin (cytochrome b1)
MQPAPCTQSEIVDELNHLLAEEMEAAVRYLHLMIVLEPRDEAILEQLQEAHDETDEHARIVGGMIRQLGGTPRTDIRLTGTPGPIAPLDALNEVLTIEEAALEGYQELLERVENNCEHPDPDVLAFLRKQVELEQEHVQEFKDLLEKETV